MAGLGSSKSKDCSNKLLLHAVSSMPHFCCVFVVGLNNSYGKCILEMGSSAISVLGLYLSFGMPFMVSVGWVIDLGLFEFEPLIAKFVVSKKIRLPVPF